MANKLEKPRDAAESVVNNAVVQYNNEKASSSPLSTQPTCNCTKISVMLLIHEMKQQYATVPDHIINQCVMDNCHNRAVLIDVLETESEKYPGSVQAYPQALRNNNKKSLIPRRTAPPVPQLGDKLYSNKKLNKNIINNDVHNQIEQLVTTEEQHKSKLLSDHLNSLDVYKILSPEPVNCIRPNRPAPPPPSPSSTPPPPPVSPTINQSACENVQSSFYNQPLSTINKNKPESNESLNVSLNVMVSPITGRPPARPPRHTTAISVQPESAFLIDSSHSARSYTSVNFTLRQPGDKPQSPIEITAGPSLTYSSRSYDARAGFQSHLAITVGGNGSGSGGGGGVGDNSSIIGGGTISASRLRPRASAYAQLTESEQTRNKRLLSLSSHGSEQLSLPNITATTVSTTTTSVTTIDKGEIVQRQLLCKQRLSVELENEKKHLQVMLREISVLQSPLPPDGCTILLDEIERLRNTCIQMAQEVEEACPLTALGETNEAFYQNIYTGQRLPIQQHRPTRSSRPPPPPPAYVLRCLSGNISPSIRQQQYRLQDQQQQEGQQQQCHNYVNNSSNIHNNAIDERDEPWTCNLCTFQNHPLLNKCEQCEMPLLSTSGTISNANSQQLLTTRLQHIPYQQQSVSSVVIPNPMQYNSSIGFNNLPPRLTQQH